MNIKIYMTTGLISLFFLSACGKSLSGTAKNTSQNINLNQLTNQPVQAKTGSNIQIPGTSVSLAAGELDGDLMPLSEYDLTELGASVTESFSEIGYPTFSVTDHGLKTGYIKNSKLVFRAIEEVPPSEAIQSVLTMELHLKGVSLFNKNQTHFDTLSFCGLDSKECISQKSGESTFFDPLRLVKAFSQRDDDSELIIDLKKAYGLTDTASQVKWIMDNSLPFDSSYYRKFRFEMGNSIYAGSGTLLIQFQTIPSKLPSDFNSAITKPIHGEADVMGVQSTSTVTDEASGLSEVKILKD